MLRLYVPDWSVRYDSTAEGTASSGNFDTMNAVPKSAGMLSKPHAEMIVQF